MCTWRLVLQVLMGLAVAGCGGRLVEPPSDKPVDGGTTGPFSAGSVDGGGAADAQSCCPASSVACGGGLPGATTDCTVGQLAVTTALEANGQASEMFDVNLQPFTPPSTPPSPCAGATLTVGDCCYYAPSPPQGIPPLGSGTPATERSAGAISLLDSTSNAHIGTYLYGNGGYGELPATYAAGTWKVADELTVSAAGDQIGAFTISAPALSPPSMALPTSIIRGQALEVRWSTDPHSERMEIQVLDTHTGAVAGCVVPEAQQRVIIDASLFASFSVGTSWQVAMSRGADRYAQTSTGRVEFSTFGWASRFCSVQ